MLNNTNNFLINTLDTIPVMYGRGDGSITDIMQLGYLRPILRQWILKIAQEQAYFNTNAELDKIVDALEHKINDLNTWITDLQVTNVYTKISQDYIYRTNQEKKDIEKKVVERFKTLDLESEKNIHTYNDHLRTLKLCYDIETVIFNIDRKDQTYLEYARTHFINMADKIKQLKIDPLQILHKK